MYESIINENGVLGIVVLFFFLIPPFYFLFSRFKSSAAIQELVAEFQADFFGMLFLFATLIMWCGFSLWMATEGSFSTGYFGVATLICFSLHSIFRKSNRS